MDELELGVVFRGERLCYVLDVVVDVWAGSGEGGRVDVEAAVVPGCAGGGGGRERVGEVEEPCSAWKVRRNVGGGSGEEGELGMLTRCQWLHLLYTQDWMCR